jgi:thiamine biosynthesis lipoprotein ApbE
VVQVAGVAKGWTIRSASCRQNKENDAYIIAWGKETTAEYMKLIKKAWRINPDKRRIEVIPVKNVDCENIGC